MKKNKGFTLIELIIATAIFVIIVAIIASSYQNINTQTRVVCIDTATKETAVDELIQGRVIIDEFRIRNYDNSYQKTIPYTYSCDAIVIKR